MLEKFLDLSSTRQKLIAGNLANVSTPNYKSKDIDFHGELKKAVGQSEHIAGKLTNPAHLPLGQNKNSAPEVIVNDSRDANGINNVDVDREVANLARNQIYYSVGAQILARKITGLKNAIKSK